MADKAITTATTAQMLAAAGGCDTNAIVTHRLIAVFTFADIITDTGRICHRTFVPTGLTFAFYTTLAGRA